MNSNGSLQHWWHLYLQSHGTFLSTHCWFKGHTGVCDIRCTIVFLYLCSICCAKCQILWSILPWVQKQNRWRAYWTGSTSLFITAQLPFTGVYLAPLLYTECKVIGQFCVVAHVHRATVNVWIVNQERKKVWELNHTAEIEPLCKKKEINMIYRVMPQKVQASKTKLEREQQHSSTLALDKFGILSTLSWITISI